MDRRSFLTTAPAVALLAVPAAAAHAPLREAVETLMASVTPGARPKWQVVLSDDLRALCEAAGVEWADHWANR